MEGQSPGPAARPGRSHASAHPQSRPARGRRCPQQRPLSALLRAGPRGHRGPLTSSGPRPRSRGPVQAEDSPQPGLVGGEAGSPGRCLTSPAPSMAPRTSWGAGRGLRAKAARYYDPRLGGTAANSVGQWLTPPRDTLSPCPLPIPPQPLVGAHRWAPHSQSLTGSQAAWAMQAAHPPFRPCSGSPGLRATDVNRGGGTALPHRAVSWRGHCPRGEARGPGRQGLGLLSSLLLCRHDT